MALSSPFSAASVSYLEALYAAWRADPDAVHFSWGVVFGMAHDLAGSEPGTNDPFAIGRSLAALIRDRGHLHATLDPLADARPDPGKAADAAALAGADPALLALYCGGLALESAHIDDPAIRADARALFEARPARPEAAARLRALDLLGQGEAFDGVLATRFPTKKRFGSEGADAIAPLLDRILHTAARDGVKTVVIGAMHRGRLSLVANVLRKPLEALYFEVIGGYPLGEPDLPADVPYHLGYEGRVAFDDAALDVCLLANPSHLEAVDPVAVGRTRARQDQDGAAGDTLCIILHTDAAVIGQGLVAETLQLSGLSGYSTGGVIHLVINNQIGFTTTAREGRTSRYCTGAWKAVDSPILHVNGDQVDEVLQAADLAVRLRARHGVDTVVDLVCYRRNGHNEIDEPRFTQPTDYALIERRPWVGSIYAATLAAEGLAEDGALEAARAARKEACFAALDRAAARMANPGKVERLPRARAKAQTDEPITGVAPPALQALAEALSQWPEDLAVGEKVKKLVRQRAGAAAVGVNWALGEALAFATLVTQGLPVRLSGQDVTRGAFSHRLFQLTDINTGRGHVSLDRLSANQARFEVINSPLSEYAVLGFEYGYSLERQHGLTLWEAQFGDFANGAQIIVDQFIASGEEKWDQTSALVMLLPHGLEGQGPEHSSARPERYLQLAANGNLQIVQPTTPANYFHLLRRQAMRRQRKPLIVMSPKKLLRLPAAISPLADFGPAHRFSPVLASVQAEPRTVLLCSGKIAYDLEAARAAHAAADVAIVRLEQLYPLPEVELEALFAQWPKARFAWVQEEPANSGGWPYLDRPLEALLARAGAAAARVELLGRRAQASPAGSFHGAHDAEQARIIEAAFSAGAPADRLAAVARPRPVRGVSG